MNTELDTNANIHLTEIQRLETKKDSKFGGMSIEVIGNAVKLHQLSIGEHLKRKERSPKFNCRLSGNDY